MKRLFAGALVLLLALFAFPQKGNATTTATFQLTATCLWGQRFEEGLVFPDCAPGNPNADLSGTFSLNTITGKLIGWDLFSQYSQNYYDSTGKNMPAPAFPPPLSVQVDEGNVSSSAIGFTIEVRRSYSDFYLYNNDPIFAGYCCWYGNHFGLDLSFDGSPATFTGGPLTNSFEEEFGDYRGLNNNLYVGYSGSAVLIATPEPGSFSLVVIGWLGITLWARKYKAD